MVVHLARTNIQLLNSVMRGYPVEMLSGGDMLIRSLRDEGVEFVFGYPGGAALHIYDALFRQQDVKHILVRHEQAATHAADGYARTTGKVGTVLRSEERRVGKVR